MVDQTQCPHDRSKATHSPTLWGTKPSDETLLLDEMLQLRLVLLNMLGFNSHDYPKLLQTFCLQ